MEISSSGSRRRGKRTRGITGASTSEKYNPTCTHQVPTRRSPRLWRGCRGEGQRLGITVHALCPVCAYQGRQYLEVGLCILSWRRQALTSPLRGGRARGVAAVGVGGGCFPRSAVLSAECYPSCLTCFLLGGSVVCCMSGHASYLYLARADSTFDWQGRERRTNRPRLRRAGRGPAERDLPPFAAGLVGNVAWRIPSDCRTGDSSR